MTAGQTTTSDDGLAVESVAGETVLRCVDPATGELLGSVPVDTPDSVRETIARGREAQRAWARTEFRTRQRVLRRVLRHVVDQADEFVETVCRDTGKTREHALIGEIWPVCEKLRWTIRRGPRHLRPERVSAGMFPHERARLEFRPRGVIGAITAYNYPFQFVLSASASALMAGNAIVLKPSEWVAWSSRQFVRILRDALAAEGLPEELVGIVQGGAATGQALVEGGVDGLLFIGSVSNGQRVIEASAKNVVPLILELGGKDPLIVCDDADLGRAVDAAVNGVFVACGQNCVAPERILLFDQIADEFEARAAKVVSAFRQGPPLSADTLDVGALTSAPQLDVVRSLVDQALARGARLVCGGRVDEGGPGSFYPPTILADVTPDMAIMHEETFGPVLVLCRVRDEAEAIRVANATRFGLSSSVFSKNHERALRIADRIEAGMTAINEFGGTTYMVPELTFGGTKHSGYGSLNGRDGLRAMCRTKAVLDARLPWNLSPALFPVSDAMYSTFKAMIHARYGGSWRQRLGGALSALRGFTKASRKRHGRK